MAVGFIILEALPTVHLGRWRQCNEPGTFCYLLLGAAPGVLDVKQLVVSNRSQSRGTSSCPEESQQFLLRAFILA